LDIFIGGGGDDLAWLGLGVVADYARSHAAATGRRTAYVANGRLCQVRRLIAASAHRGEPICLVGHSWGGPGAWRAAAWANSASLPLKSLITLDPVAGPFRRRFIGDPGCPWLNVVASASSPDRSDRLTDLWGLSRKPSRLPLESATRHVVLDLNHWNVVGMMEASGALVWMGEQH
jgi:pimeloyl-ACP methyl ester carboxylesterase